MNTAMDGWAALNAERDHYKALCGELREALRKVIKKLPLEESYQARAALLKAKD